MGYQRQQIPLYTVWQGREIKWQHPPPPNLRCSFVSRPFRGVQDRSLPLVHPVQADPWAPPQNQEGNGQRMKASTRRQCLSRGKSAVCPKVGQDIFGRRPAWGLSDASRASAVSCGQVSKSSSDEIPGILLATRQEKESQAAGLEEQCGR